VLPADRLDGEGRAFAQSLASGPTRAHAVTKRVLDAWRSGGVWPEVVRVLVEV
jgi:hypothetical protein